MGKNVDFLNNNSVANITANFERVNDALEDVVARSGELPNSMEADLDINSFDLLNVGMVDASSYLFNGEDLLDSQLIIDGIALTPLLEEIVPITDDITTVSNISSAIVNISNNISDISNFGDVYLGAKSVEPTTRNDGSPLQPGDLYFDQTDSALHYYTGVAWVDSAEQGLNLGTDYFVGDGVETNFTAGSNISQAQNAFVWVGGVRQRPNIDYTVSGSTISFVTPPANDEEIDVLILALVNEIDVGVPSDGTVDADTITNDSGEQLAITQKLGVEVGVDVQAYDTLLQAIAAATGTNGAIIRFTGADTIVVQPIVGTVSQSGGVPTGAIIERGSNGNGEFVKYADGTMICTGSVSVPTCDQAFGSGYITTSADRQTVTFAAAFAAAPKVTASVQVVGGVFAVVSGVSSTTANILIGSFSSLATAQTVTYMAIGRWF